QHILLRSASKLPSIIDQTCATPSLANLHIHRQGDRYKYPNKRYNNHDLYKGKGAGATPDDSKNFSYQHNTTRDTKISFPGQQDTRAIKYLPTRSSARLQKQESRLSGGFRYDNQATTQRLSGS